MNLKELSVISLTMLMLSFMGILMCVSLLFGEDSEGSGTSGISPGGNSVSEEVLKHRSMVEKYAKRIGHIRLCTNSFGNHPSRIWWHNGGRHAKF